MDGVVVARFRPDVETAAMTVETAAQRQSVIARSTPTVLDAPDPGPLAPSSEPATRR